MRMPCTEAGCRLAGTWGKGGAVNWNEGLHSWLRSQLNRLVRDTTGYTKSAQMLVYPVALMVEAWTAQFNASLC